MTPSSPAEVVQAGVVDASLTPKAAQSIRLNNVGKVFEDSELQVVALDGISFSVEPGQFLSIIGPSGCGKSTLLRISAGLISSTTGEVFVGDRKVDGPLGEVGFVFQDATLMKWRTVLKNVMFPYEVASSQGRLRGSRKDYEDRARELLKRAGLDGFEGAYPKQLSGGMQHRVSICRALLMDPPLLLMDEPFGALDELTREMMNDELLALCQETGKTVLFVTHHIPEAVFLSDRVVVLTSRPGRIGGTLDVNLPRPRSAEVRDLPQFHADIVAVRRLIVADAARDPLVG